MEDDEQIQFEDEYGNIYYLDENGMFKRMGAVDPQMSHSLMDLAKQRMMNKYATVTDTPITWFFNSDKGRAPFKASIVPNTLKEMVEEKK